MEGDPLSLDVCVVRHENGFSYQEITPARESKMMAIFIVKERLCQLSLLPKAVTAFKVTSARFCNRGQNPRPMVAEAHALRRNAGPCPPASYRLPPDANKFLK